MTRKIFITGIGTDVGKTIVSAILTEALQADYWKPVQAGTLAQTDSEIVKSLISNNVSHILTESYLLETPISPHAAALAKQLKIKKENIIQPNSNKKILIIEGAGGLMVPLSENFLILDLIKQLNAETILVSKNYLGSINHTLLSFNALLQYKIPITGIIFNGKENPSSEEFILEYTKLKLLGRVDEFSLLTKEWIIQQAEKFKQL